MIMERHGQNRSALVQLIVVCSPLIIMVSTQSEKYQQIHRSDPGFSFSRINLGLVRSKMQCTHHCNSDDDCAGVGLMEERQKDGKRLSCFMMKKEPDGDIADQNVRGAKHYQKDML